MSCVIKDIKKHLADVKLYESKLREMSVSVLHWDLLTYKNRASYI
jgi:hypothetical protein